MNQKPSIGYAVQFALLLGLMGIAFMISSLLMGLVAAQVMNKPLLQAATDLIKPEHANLARFLNTATTFIAFFIPALAVARLASKRPLAYLGFNNRFSSRQIGLVGLITLGSLFLSGGLASLNEMIPMSETFLKKARELEDQYRSAMIGMATMRSFADYALSLLVIALAPAIFEEVLFRGSMQTILSGWTKNAWAGILITSVIFSAIHGSYFGFLPRLALGIILGMIFLQSGNLWLSIAMHFLNNAIVVTQMYSLTRMGKPIQQAMDESMPVWYSVIAIAILYYAFRLFKKESKQINPPTQPAAEYGTMD
ncbi:MAG TPA: type II CAAX endopeptidase family protein [Sediminibacterium sp.]|nr:type II CAAX endopeptidase family protein [Sediminibacterium sp.]